ncbi:hypothetical protein O5O45_04615 [Hahella aquimaris]|uniref:hypothetical protein n=1 Tax=Hahella sp. HNIBRBA332 TaxID=3015983 RepID=UPI00273B2620|nr:hypothetical protein [Hahella sp. HNIBRBA332]WLQ15212.1 hypothetical protein O5O45_04615 [Hahella sp. HNIBRBA332]
METIKPEKDEVDRFQSQRHKAPATKPAEPKKAAPVAEAPVEAYVRLSRPAQWAIVFVFILVLTFALIGYWQVKNQQQTILSLQNQLQQATQYISQSKLVTARLEGQINQTDATMAQSGNEMARELKTLDSEIRKLWDVSNKRNKQLIEDNQKALKALQGDFKQSQERVKALSGEINGLTVIGENLGKSQEAQALQISALADDMGRTDEALERKQAELAQLLKQSSDKLEKALSEQTVALAKLERMIGKMNEQNLEGNLKELEKKVSAIDATRNQLVQRYVELDRRMNEIGLQLKAMQK